MSTLGRVLDDAGAQLTEWRVGRPEGAEDGRGRWIRAGFRQLLVGDLVDEATLGCQKWQAG